MTKILVINLMHIGDLLLVTPVLRALRTQYPDAFIALLADRKLADLVRLNQNIDELIDIDKKGYHDRTIPYLGVILDIRRRGFDIVINLHANERASFIAALSGGKKIVGYSTFGPHWLFDAVLENRKAVKHQVHAHFDVLRETLGIEHIDDRGIEMWLDEDAPRFADELWLEAYGAQQADGLKIVGLNIGASWPTKRWRHEYFAELADTLLDRGYGVAYFGGPMDNEIVDQAMSLMRLKEHPLLRRFTGQLSLMQLAAVLKKLDVLVTNDTGPMHIAVAMNVPLVSMFGPSPVPGFYPYNDISVVLKTPVSCHPCGKHVCPTGHECMWEITMQDVLAPTLRMLQASGFEALREIRKDYDVTCSER